MAAYTLEVTEKMVLEAGALAHQALNAKSYQDFRQAIIKLNSTVRGHTADSASDFRSHDEVLENSGRIIWVAPPHNKVEYLMQEAWNKSRGLAERERERELVTYTTHCIASTLSKTAMAEQEEHYILQTHLKINKISSL